MPSNLIPKRRKRRFPERELLERVRRYEDLLRSNKVAFEPMHGNGAGGDVETPAGEGDGEDDEGGEQKGVDAKRPPPLYWAEGHKPKWVVTLVVDSGAD